MEETKQESAVSVALAKLNVDEKTSIALKDAFAPFEQQANEWKEKAAALTVTDKSEVDKMQQSRKARLALRQTRISVENLHKEKKADILRDGRVLDMIKNTLVDLISPIETQLQANEDFIKNAEAKEKAELRSTRLLKIKEIEPMAPGYENMPLEEMPEQTFETLLLGLGAAKEQREAGAREIQRIKNEQAQAAETERKKMLEENERLRLAKEKITKRINRLSALGLKYHDTDPTGNEPEPGHPYAKGYAIHVGTHWIIWSGIEDATDEQFDEEFSRLEPIINTYNERKKKEAERTAESLRVAEIERKRLEKENNDRLELEESNRKLAKAAERKAKRAPDKTKLLALADSFEAIQIPTMREDDTIEIATNAQALADRLIKYIRKQCENL